MFIDKQQLHIFTVSVNYLDEIKYSASYNLQRQFNTWTIITDVNDINTQQFLHDLQKTDRRIRVHISDKAYTEGVFNKAALLNDALYCGPEPGSNVWWLFLDSDIIFLNDIPYKHLKKGYLHGAFRRLWKSFCPSSPLPFYKNIPIEIGTIGLGYFALVHSLDPRHNHCPPFKEDVYTTAASYDMDYLLRWPIHLTRYLPIELVHLGNVINRWMGEISRNNNHELSDIFKLELRRRFLHA